MSMQAILLMGPTASGKTAAAIELASRFPLEIVSVDSAMVYRDMNIGTAKPDAETLRVAPHHLIDLISPEEAYSAARFHDDALQVMHDISARGRIPLLVGGTMLYFRALQQGLSPLPQADAGLRAQIEQEAAERGWPAMHAELARVDPEAAARIQDQDAQRIQRGLEVWRLTGRSLSWWWSVGQTARPDVRWLPLALVTEHRAELHQRIADRFAVMLEQGLVDELADLRRRYQLDPTMSSMRCVGYRQAWSCLDGEFGPEELYDRGVYATRQLAKRQLTWLRSMDAVERFDCLAASLHDQLADRIADWLADSGEQPA